MSPRFLKAVLGLAALLIMLGHGAGARALAAEPLPATLNALTALSLEELMEVEVTSAARKPQRLAETATAIFVITPKDIRRSGATSIPELLRMVPGLQVARINSNQWVVTSRGFASRFANKLLVLIDGRSVYTPLFSGVFWEVQDLPLEDIERIEVIRGPGAALWGANAVNGVINILTKSAEDTQGGLLSVGAGTEERAFGTMRYGSQLGNGAYLRLYGRVLDRDDFVDARDGSKDSPDDWRQGRAGFRLDWQVPGRDSFTLQGDAYNGEAGQLLQVSSLLPPFVQVIARDAEFSGANLLGRWRRSFSPSSEMALQVYYDLTQRDGPILDEARDTFDIDFQQRFTAGGRHHVVWGLGYRLSRDELTGTVLASIDPERRDTTLLSAFVQDEVMLARDWLRLTLGSKFEHNDFTGFEVQPNARLLWTPDDRQTLWLATSRAVRTPSRVEDDIRVNFVGRSVPGVLVAIQGDRDFDAEKLTAYELGYRIQPSGRLNLDLAAFHNVYDDLRTFETRSPVAEIFPLPPHLLVANLTENRGSGNTWGLELAADWRPRDGWRLQLAYSYLEMDLKAEDGSRDTSLDDQEDASPKHQVSLRSSTDLARNVELDLWVRYTDAFDGLGASPIASQTALDLRLAWRPHKDLELSIVGQNLLDDRHLEFVSDSFSSPVEVERGVYGKLTWRF
jgi:iron complex outermembrane receptor protein